MDFTSGTATYPAPAAGHLDFTGACAPSHDNPASQCANCPVKVRCLTSGTTEWETVHFARLALGRRRARKGQAVYRVGDRFLFVYAVRFGSFKSTIVLPDGREQVVAFHLPGDVVGLDATATGAHPTTLTALENAEICAIPYSQLSDVSAESRTLREHLVRIAGSELVRDHKLLALIAHSHAEERVAAFLVQLSERMQERGYSPREFNLRMTRADIGSYLGTTLETVSRTLSAFARRGIVSVERRRIQVLDMDALRAARAYA
ncbi:helix-turn-helix domain-containing protein [Ramlibacter albus]|uniref:Helix-turn-helix domain-containing protein n=1 Tax=Ramlibacter albus TaxID=2079448 RepID=A0A923M5U9_9BURK|nr:helix-turn-helix domain-containing protein [Ramlibacter albus]MBC5763930.1 helix-turn-helix domain-containing protein [Ramlibacter albus]